MPLDKTPQLFFSMSMTMQQLRRSTLGSLANPTISFKSNFSWAPEKLGTAPGPASQEPASQEHDTCQLVADPSIVAKNRADFFKKYVKRASELAGQEEELRSRMPQHVLELVDNKRVVLWKEILSDYGYPDVN